MGNGKMLDSNISSEAFRGYVMAKLESIDGRTEKTEQRVGQVEKTTQEIKENISSPEKCGVPQLYVAIFGDKEGQKRGIIHRLGKLEVSHKIKSGIYGVIGGSIILLSSVVIGLLIAYTRGVFSGN